MDSQLIGVTLMEIIEISADGKNVTVKPIQVFTHAIDFFDPIFAKPDADGKRKLLHYVVHFRSGVCRKITIQSFAEFSQMMAQPGIAGKPDIKIVGGGGVLPAVKRN